MISIYNQLQITETQPSHEYVIKRIKVQLRNDN